MPVQTAGSTAKTFLFSLGLLLSAPDVASAASTDALLEYTLDELVSLQVETASRSIEPLDRTPASVYVVTADDIRTYGYRTLADVLENVPGFNGINLGFTLQGGQRGQPGNFAQTLLLVNGREFQGLATQEAFISDQFGIDNIRQIEIMNSPGSVLYGANAYSGVINILTKDADPDFIGQQARLALGSENTQALSLVSASQTALGRVSFYFRQYRSDNWNFGGFVADREHFSAGFPAVFQNASAAAGQDYENRSMARSWAARLEKNGFYLGSDGYYLESGKGLEAVAMDYHSQRDVRDLSLWYGGWQGTAWGSKITAEYQFLRDRFWGLNYAFRNSVWQALLAGGRNPDAPLTQQEIYEDFQFAYSQENSPGSQRHRAFIELQKEFSASAQLTAGIVGEYRDLLGTARSTSDPSPSFDTTLADSNPLHRPLYRSNKESAYLQWRQLLAEQLDLTLGARMDDQSQYGTISTLRGGLVWHAGPGTHWRLLYGEAFREPTIFELGTSKPPGTPASADLQPAIIETIEIGLVQHIAANQRLQITAFDNQAETITPVTTSTFANTRQHIRGVESKYDFREGRWRLDGAWTWMHTDKKTVAGQEVESLNVYEHRVSFGAGFLPAENWRLGLRANYFDELNAEDGNPLVERVITIPAAVRLDLNLAWLPSLLRPDDTRIDFSIHNLTDKQYYQPNVRNTGPVEFLQPGRQFLLSLTLNF